MTKARYMRALEVIRKAAASLPSAIAVSSRAMTITPVFALAGAVLIGLIAVAIGMPDLGMPGSHIDQHNTQVALQSGATMLSLVCGFIFITYSRFRRSNEAAWVGAALITLGACAIGVAALVPYLSSDAAGLNLVVWLQPGGRLAAMLLLIVAIWTSRIDDAWRRRPSRVLLITIATTAVATLFMESVSNLAAGLISAHDVIVQVRGLEWFHAVQTTSVIPVAWLSLATAFLLTAIRRNEPLLTWVALACIAFGGAELARLAATSQGLAGSILSYVVQTVGLALSVVGVLRGMSAHIREQRGQLLSRAEAAEAQADNTTRKHREQVHEALNALSSVVNTLRLIEQQRDQLDPSIQRKLIATSFAELLRLQGVFAPHAGSANVRRYELATALQPVIEASRANGLVINDHLPDGVFAWGSPAATSQVLQNLLENAARYAPGATVDIHGAIDDQQVLLSVTDDGPGIDPEEHERVFAHGVRGSSSAGTTGSGIGLAVSADLMRAHGGGLWIDGAHYDGTRFVIALPTAPAEPSPPDSSNAQAPPGDSTLTVTDPQQLVLQ